MRARLLLLIALLLVGSACSSRRSGQASAAVPRSPAVLNVDNRHWLDVVVYVVHGGRRVRVGEVSAARAARFALIPSMLGPTGQIRLTADPVGSSEVHTTHPIVVRPGQRVEWTLERTLATSSVLIR